jgi:transposase
VLARLDTTYQAGFRRVQRGEQAGCPRFTGRERFHSCTDKYKQYGNGVRLDNGVLVLARIGRSAVRWSRPVAGTSTTVPVCREADGWYVAISCADVPVHPLPLTGQQTGIDLGVESFATLATGEPVATPRIFRVAERHLRRAQRRVSRRTKGSRRRRTAVHLLARAHQRVRRARTDCHHKTALALVRQYDTISHEDVQTARRPTCSRITTWRSRSPTLGGVRSCASCRAQQQTLGRPSSRCRQRSPAKPVRAAALWCTRACPSAGIRAQTVGRACIGTIMPPSTSCA